MSSNPQSFDLPIHYPRHRKRKRSKYPSPPASPSASSDSQGESSHRPRSRSSSPDLPLPGSSTSLPGSAPENFPHGRAGDGARRTFALPSLTSNDGSARRRPSAARQDLAAVTAILHRSLLDRKWARAERAFVILLKMNVAGKSVDLRRNGLWGIGAEILLNRPAARLAADEAAPDAEDETPGESNEARSPAKADPADWYSDEGFEAAKKYYERLILQFPFRRTRPKDVSAVTFYPALLNLWVMQIQAREKRMLAEVRERSEARDGQNAEDSLGESIMLVKQAILRQVRELIDRLRNITRMPPYDEHVRLVRLRGMVALWTSTLLRPAGETDERQESDLRAAAAEDFDFVLRKGGRIPEQTTNAARASAVRQDVQMNFADAEW